MGVRSLIELGFIDLMFVDTNHQLADIFTKYLPPAKVQHHMPCIYPLL